MAVSVSSGSISGGLGSITMSNNSIVTTGSAYGYGIRVGAQNISRGTAPAGSNFSWTQTAGGYPAGTYTVRAYAVLAGVYTLGATRTITIYTAAVLTTTAPSAITISGATCGGNITSGGGYTPSSRGVCWNTTGAPTTANPKTVDGSGVGVFTSTITGLAQSTTYYVRAYAVTPNGTWYGDQQTLTTQGKPTVSTSAIGAIYPTTAIGGGTVADNGFTITERGLCYGLTTAPTTGSTKVIATGTTGTFTATLTGTSVGNTYYVRAYAINSYGLVYGNEVTFSTTLPTVTTTAITNVVIPNASGGGNVTAIGGSVVTSRGICWNKSGTPTTGDTYTVDGSGTGSYASQLTGLQIDNDYYVRAYAASSIGIAYGAVVTFTTPITPPVLTGGTDYSLFPNIGWSGITNYSVWTGSTHQRWYHKLSTDSSYTLLATLPKATGNTYQKLGLSPNVNYSFFSTFYKTGVESSGSNVITINNTVAAPVVTYSSILMV